MYFIDVWTIGKCSWFKHSRCPIRQPLWDRVLFIWNKHPRYNSLIFYILLIACQYNSIFFLFIFLFSSRWSVVVLHTKHSWKGQQKTDHKKRTTSQYHFIQMRSATSHLDVAKTNYDYFVSKCNEIQFIFNFFFFVFSELSIKLCSKFFSTEYFYDKTFLYIYQSWIPLLWNYLNVFV